MAMSLKNPRAEALAREVARETGESLTQAIVRALEERLERLRGRRAAPDVAREIIRVAERCRALPDLDRRSADEILGYGPGGTFGPA